MEVNMAFALAASGPLARVPGYSDLPIVSSDFRGDCRSSIVDGLMTTVLPAGERMIRAVSWYDNEWGYASRVADLASFISAYGSDRGPTEKAPRIKIGRL
jgi:glyceraldehyde 3-phosphate dehydrogenase